MITLRSLSDEALNDSDKSLTYADSTRGATLYSLRVEYTATATATNRSLEVRFLDTDGDIVYAVTSATAITPSDVMITNFSPGALTVAPVDATSEGTMHIATGLPPNGSIQVIDVNAVAAAADDMQVHLVYGTY